VISTPSIRLGMRSRPSSLAIAKGAVAAKPMTVSRVASFFMVVLLFIGGWISAVLLSGTISSEVLMDHIVALSARRIRERRRLETVNHAHGRVRGRGLRRLA
jgi:hypothetical protein